MQQRLVTCLAVLFIVLIFGIYTSAAPVYNPLTGHFYDVIDVPGRLTCPNADTAAESLTFGGTQGHLVTITSQEENDFIEVNFPWACGVDYCLGGFQPPGSPEPAGGWEWVTGEPWVYTNWGPGEPNNSIDNNEDWLFLRQDCKWNDARGFVLRSGYMVEYDTDAFTDVPTGFWAEEAIYRIYDAGITKGCSQNPLMFCPDRLVTRAVAAVLIGRAKHGSSFIPAPATGIFPDVPVTHWFADWMEQFYNDGITKGCQQNPLMFCPDKPLPRGPAAVLLLRAKHGSSYVPPPATGIFDDIPLSCSWADWAEQLYREGITNGCQQNPLKFCPEREVRRDVMAVFLTRAFGLTLGDGLVASYPFNGNANDESGNGYDGIIHGDTSLCEDRFGNSNSAYYFDGNGDYIEIGQEPDIPSWVNYSVSLWFLNDGLGAPSCGGGVGTGEKILDKTVWFHDFYINICPIEPDPAFLSFFTYEGDSDELMDDSIDYQDNSWHHVVINKAGNNGEMWVDGKLVDTSNTVKTVNSNGDLLIGYSTSGDFYQRHYWSGKIDDIRLYNRALSESEIKALYNLSD